MSDYKKLIEALRCCIPNPPETCEGCTYNTDVGCNVARMLRDAADAIEALEKQIDSIENEKTNLEADIINLEIALDKANTQLPKRGKWIHGKELSRAYIGNCCVGIVYEDFRCSACGVVVKECEKPKWKYCPNCGAKMEAQDDKA